jgi:hypothetical protein
MNVASMNIRIGDLANRISSHFGVGIRELPDSPTYNFALDTTISRSFADPVDMSLEEHADEFTHEMGPLE